MKPYLMIAYYKNEMDEKPDDIYPLCEFGAQAPFVVSQGYEIYIWMKDYPDGKIEINAKYVSESDYMKMKGLSK